MTSTTFFIIFIPILSIILLSVNLLLSPHNPYQEKDSAFECGFHSFLGQNRTQFSVSFFIFGLLFLLFDLEILLVYPYSVSSYTNDIYGLIIMIIFFILLTLGFIFELGKNALSIDSKQTVLSDNKDVPNIDAFFSLSIHSSIIKYTFINKRTLVVILTISVLLCIEHYCNFDFIVCDAPRAWGLYFQDSASIWTEYLSKLYDNIMYYSSNERLCGVCLEGDCNINRPHQVPVAEGSPCRCCGMIPGRDY